VSVKARALALCLLIVSLLASSSSAQAQSLRKSSRPLQVVVAENFWGSIAKQEAGSRAHVTSIIANPNADPHAYEPKTSDARLIADAQYVVLNGAGYDPWGPKLLSANPVRGRRVLIVGDFIGKKEGDNPHMWYSPSYVARVAARITADYKSLDPGDAAYFDRQHANFMNVALKPYYQEISLIGRKYHGVPVAATESIFQYLAQALRLNLITPYGFMKAISEGTEPTAQDKVTFDRQVTSRQIKVFVFNSQNSTPDVNALLSKAKQERIPIVPITETLQPAAASFQAWQTAQFRALQAALHKATGK
jgi:zinc/manganese transport system substrate-binding protein